MQIVYVSAKEEYAMQLFNIRPMNFLVKPINYQKVAYILDEYERLYDFQNRFFTYNIGKRKYRMNENLATFFTSNLNIDELESTLAVTKDKSDKVKARRIIERIKFLTEDIEIIGKNRR